MGHGPTRPYIRSFDIGLKSARHGSLASVLVKLCLLDRSTRSHTARKLTCGDSPSARPPPKATVCQFLCSSVNWGHRPWGPFPNPTLDLHPFMILAPQAPDLENGPFELSSDTCSSNLHCIFRKAGRTALLCHPNHNVNPEYPQSKPWAAGVW